MIVQTIEKNTAAVKRMPSLSGLSPAIGETRSTWFLGQKTRTLTSKKHAGARPIEHAEQFDETLRGTWFLGRKR